MGMRELVLMVSSVKLMPGVEQAVPPAPPEAPLVFARQGLMAVSWAIRRTKL
jgi:hypothetical protein